MDNDLAFKALFHRYKEHKLAHFYTLHTGGQKSVDEKDTILNDWCTNFLTQVLAFENQWSIEHAKESLNLGHEDILFVETSEKSYKVSDKSIEEFFNFIRFRPSKLKYSITIFKQSQKISQILSNKLLKTLEEPPHGHIFFFLKSNDEKTLATIDSRTIKINIASSNDVVNPTDFKDFKSYISANCQNEELIEILSRVNHDNLCLEELKDLIKDTPAIEIDLCHYIGQFLSNHTGTKFDQAQQCLNAIEYSTKEIPFNGAAKSRLARILQLIV